MSRPQHKAIMHPALWSSGALLAALVCLWPSSPALAGDFDRAMRGMEQRSARIHERYSPCVVGIEVTAHVMPAAALPMSMGPHWPVARAGGGAKRQGTGFVVDSRGFILTSQRLFDGIAGDGASTHVPVRIRLDDGESVDGVLWAVDQLTRLAVVRSDRPFERYLEFADEAPGVGAMVFTLTRPYDLSNSLYFGNVNGVDRRVGASPIERMFQTSLPLFPGGPGSPVLDVNGKVLGMLQDARHQPNISFAFSTPRLQAVARQLIEFRARESGCLGLSVTPVSREDCAKFRIDEAWNCHGALVQQVYRETPAAKAGLLPNDLITELEGARISDPDDLIHLMFDYRPGDWVRLTYRRGDDVYTAALELERFPADLTRR